MERRDTRNYRIIFVMTLLARLHMQVMTLMARLHSNGAFTHAGFTHSVYTCRFYT